MPQEQHGPIASRLLLGKALQQLRSEAGMSGAEVARAMGFGAAKLSKIERGQAPITKADLHLFFEVLKVSEDVRPTLLELGAQSRRPRRNRTNTSEQELPGKNFERYLGLEEIAIGIKDWHPYLIPGLLQTPEYARALIAANPLLLPDQVKYLVELRMERQRALHRETEPLQLWSIVEEYALRRVIGGKQTRDDQLRHLLTMGRKPNINIQVIPDSAGAHAGLDGAFAILDAGNHLPPVVYIDSRGMNTYVEGVTDLAVYKATYDQIQSSALSPVQSAAVITAILEEPE
ncbi:helix-turn-helix transcriptional regulator [Nocardiopsis sp. NRRL B-16309]|uniref:helix-turn-helix domain-containing protein n=1 Tax=Nocardiopsis sp. NRRL B-16309 TaxID=1519494 RepID=UPI0006AFFF8D|nr:helix-turn-helix transcriptional regulator [Nocardiopsis sp. NRRL B-16309]KOX17018.1 XRE family transcriptional regulator [Nocardiopsis sp. NRRL B-16309]